MNNVNVLIVHLLIGFVLISCNSHYSLIKFSNAETKLKLKVPANYKFMGIGGGSQVEHRYIYSDSSIIYITSFDNTVNYSDIREQGTYYERFFALKEGDTLTLKGVDSSGLYWKDSLLYQGITIGYSNVPKSKLLLYENIINSVKVVSKEKD